MLKSHWSLCVTFSRRAAGLCIYHLFVWSNLDFLHNSQWVTLPTHSCLFSYSFCANLLHLLIMWLIVSSLSLHNLHLLFCCILSILSLVLLDLMALLCAAIMRDWVSLLRFLFLSHVSIVYGGCYQSFSALFYVIFKSLLWCVNAVFNSGKSSSVYFSWYIYSINVISGM